jgi:ATP-dependent Clp protease protease subunit
MLEKGRVIFLVGQIEERMAMNICAQLLHLASISTDDISLYINSPGGVITAALAIYDTMQSIEPDVKTFCCGQAASAGALLLTAGASGKRYILPHARTLIHQPAISGGGISGQETDISIQAKEVARLRTVTEDIFNNHTKQPTEKLRRDMERDLIMNAQESVEYGLVDQVFINQSPRGKL